MKCFVWSIALYSAETWTLRRNEQKRLEEFEMWMWWRMERVKWTENKNAVVLERVGEGRIMLELIKKRKRNWLGHWLRWNCLLKDALEVMVNWKKIWGRRRYEILIENIMINGLYEDTKRKAEKRVERTMLSLKWKTCCWAEHYDWLIFIFVGRDRFWTRVNKNNCNEKNSSKVLYEIQMLSHK